MTRDKKYQICLVCEYYTAARPAADPWLPPGMMLPAYCSQMGCPARWERALDAMKDTCPKGNWIDKP